MHLNQLLKFQAEEKLKSQLEFDPQVHQEIERIYEFLSKRKLRSMSVLNKAIRFLILSKDIVAINPDTLMLLGKRFGEVCVALRSSGD